MRYLGIDYGSKRIGIAVSDEGGIIAFPRAAVKTADDVVKTIGLEKIGKVIVGLPMGAGGQETAQTKIVRAFAAALGKAVSLPIEFENEVLTTKIAERHSPRKAVDASAAALILQSYLDKHVKRVK